MSSAPSLLQKHALLYYAMRPAAPFADPLCPKRWLSSQEIRSNVTHRHRMNIQNGHRYPGYSTDKATGFHSNLLQGQGVQCGSGRYAWFPRQHIHTVVRFSPYTGVCWQRRAKNSVRTQFWTTHSVCPLVDFCAQILVGRDRANVGTNS